MNALTREAERYEFPSVDFDDSLPLDDPFLQSEPEDDYDDEEARLLVMYSGMVGGLDAA